MTLRADDGTFLEAKEGAILDKEGNTLLDRATGPNGNGSYQEYDASASYKSNIKLFKLSPWMIPLVAAGLVMAVALGTVVLGGIFCLFLAVWFLRSIFRALR